MKLRTLFVCAFVSALPVASAQANPVDVTYAVSGSAGNWTYDFSVTDNLGTSFSVYYFGVLLPTDTIKASPSGWVDFATIGNIPVAIGSNAYYDVWRVYTPFISSVSPGQTLSGFEILDKSQTPLSSIGWFAQAVFLIDPQDFDPNANYTGPGCVFNCGMPGRDYNPGFENTAFAATTPLPAALPLFATGLGGLGLLGWRRKRRAQAAI
jgi:hypothetical protein